MKIQILAIVFSLLSFTARAEDKYLIRSGDVRAENFKTFLNLNPGFKAYTKYWPTTQPASSESDQLRRATSQAQKNFLSENREQSIAAFKAVVELALDADWNKFQREAIFTSYLRLAQLEDKKRNEWISAAICFDPEQNISADLFAPPLQTAFQDMKASMAWERFENTNVDFPVVLVNGRSVSFRQSAKLCAGKTRFSFVSDAYQPVSRTESVAFITSWSPSKRPLIQGTCEKANLPEENLIPRKRAYALFNDSCIKDLTTEEAVASGVAFPKSMAPRPSWLERNWIWTGLGLLAGAVVVTEVHRQNQPTEASHIEGF